MPKSNVKLDIRLESRNLDKKIRQFSRDHGKTLWDTIKMGVEWFTQTVVKKTPPIGKTMKKRDVILLKTNRFSRRGKELKRYKVPFRTNKKKGAKYFDKKKDANAFAQIKYRFIGKFGWLAAGESFLRKNIPTTLRKKAGKNLSFLEAKAREIQAVKPRRIRLKPFVILINKVRNISRYSDFAVAQALRTTKNRFRGASREIKKKLMKQWQSQQ